MKYCIQRTTQWQHPFEKPCKNAYQDGVDCDGEPIWFIDIDTLEQLQEIINETKYSIVLGSKGIEIYDDYRE